MQRETREHRPLEARHHDRETGTEVTRSRGPVRTCVGCRRTRPRHELVRLARTPEGVRYDRRRRAPGRGANLCPDLSCIEAASERGAGRVRRALRGVPELEVRAALDELRREVASDDAPPTWGDQAPDEGAVRSLCT